MKLLVALSVFLFSLVHAAPKGHRKHPCAHTMGGIHVLMTRGSTEPIPGSLATIAEAVVKAIPGSTMKSIDYPALLPPAYITSVDNGTHMLSDEIERNIRVCPKNRIVLLGYSQGAQVTMNALCGTHEPGGFTDTPRLKKHLWKHIAAVMNYADLTQVGGKPWNVGTAAGSTGVFPRINPDDCDPFADRMRNYCDQGDPWCACGDDGEVHTSYFDIYNNVTIPWIISKAKEHTPWLK